MKLLIILTLLISHTLAQGNIKVAVVAKLTDLNFFVEITSCTAEEIKVYNMPLRVGGLFIILGTSAIGKPHTFFTIPLLTLLGVFTPIIMHRISPFQKGSTRDWILTMGKFCKIPIALLTCVLILIYLVGTGVILATAFVHILPAALTNFNSPCLSDGWRSYSAFAGVFCMISSFALQLLELAAVANVERIRARKVRDTKEDIETPSGSSLTSATLFDDHHHVHSAGMFEDGDAFKHIGTLILELGIVMHSVIVGVALSTTGTEQYMTLLIALVFHQVDK